jgi:hypothetical protein
MRGSASARARACRFSAGGDVPRLPAVAVPILAVGQPHGEAFLAPLFRRALAQVEFGALPLGAADLPLRLVSVVARLRQLQRVRVASD